jgi:H+/Cl- antiporter ClcA
VRQFALLAGVAVVVGLVAGAGASTFIWVEHSLQHWLWHTLPEDLGHDQIPVWMVFAILLVGAVLTYLARKLPGHGGHTPLSPFALDITIEKAGSVVLAALASLSFGAVLGPEAPLIAIGTALGGLAVRRRPRPVIMIMMLSGAMAAVGAIFGNPLITVILLLEMAIIAGPPLTTPPVLLSALASLAAGYVLQVGVADWSGLGEAQLGVPGLPPYPEVRIIDVLVAIPMSVAVAAIGMSARLLGADIEKFTIRRPLIGILAAAVVIATAASLVMVITDQNVDLVLFSGQSAIPDYLAMTSVTTAFLVLVAKFTAYSVSLGGGFRGGAIFPAIALGVLTVSILAQLSDDALSESALAAAAIAAATAATMRLPFIATMLGVMLTHPAGGATTVTAIVGTIVGLLTRMSAEQRFPGLAPVPREPAAPAAPAA